MPLISLVFVLIIVGVLLYVVNTLIPMDAKIKQIINLVVILVVIFWLLSLFIGGTGSLPNLRVGR